ncbi:Hsp20/alpha crystallin family protein [Halorubrum sp. SD626R]|uniref:Hsp20/alpha crystallin family protein n=1 Tax=Halorubrum TaxID=56688 RepID=UPI0010F5C7EE|nr:MULTISPECIES: Hsp20/alpha crystallin family protein [Halorubrum]TKX78973.1 Hsp20/alpha crystallin family protein [Halorubrum sp. SD626R]
MTRRDPFDEIDDLLDRMGREFEELGETFGAPDATGAPGLFGARDPPVDVLEDDDALTVLVDLPGFDDDDIDVELREDALTVAATREETSEATIDAATTDDTPSDGGESDGDEPDGDEPDGNSGETDAGETATGGDGTAGAARDDAPSVRYHRRERRGRSVSRTIRLPEPVERAEATASYDDGVLTVTLPKRSASDAGGHRIDVN